MVRNMGWGVWGVCQHHTAGEVNYRNLKRAVWRRCPGSSYCLSANFPLTCRCPPHSLAESSRNKGSKKKKEKKRSKDHVLISSRSVSWKREQLGKGGGRTGGRMRRNPAEQFLDTIASGTQVRAVNETKIPSYDK